ncbi:Nn.00g117780.m01.CDS01 [Neocucurbitaria sp. VM-36]
MATGTNEIRIEFKNPTCILWAVVALARLDEKLPSDNEAYDFLQQEIPHLFRLRSALCDTIRAFSDPAMTYVWDSLYIERSQAIIDKLKRTAADYYEHPSSQPDPDDEFMYLFSIFEAFHLKIREELPQDPEDAYGAVGMTNAVAIKLANLTGGILRDMIDPLNALFAGGAPDSAIDDYLTERTDLMCTAIEQFIREQADLKVYGNFDENGNIGEMFVRLVRAPLREQIDNCFESLFAMLDFGSGHAIDKDDDGPKAEIAHFLCEIARFFTYASPLLSDFWITESDSDSDGEIFEQIEVPEHIADHDFANYQDGDWFWQEYDVNTLVDVLAGPNNVHVDQVSSVTMTTELSSCGICHDSESPMRSLHVCGHEFCEDCLTQQLNTYHEMRYKCASCRAKFFSGNEE